MIKKHKIYSRPRKPFDKERFAEEAVIIKDYGLKNKREIWKIEAAVKSMRHKAKDAISAGPEKQKDLFIQLQKRGFNVNTISEILSLMKKDVLERRLQTILVRKNLAQSMKAARQMIVHKKVYVDGRMINAPSYIVFKEEENKINIKASKPKKPKAEENGN